MLLSTATLSWRALLSSVLLWSASCEALAAGSAQHPLNSATSQVPYSYDAQTNAYKVTGLSRSIEFGGATTKASSVFTVQNTGVDVASNEWIFPLSDNSHGPEKAVLSWLDATTGRTGATRKTAKITPLGYDAAKHANFYKVILPASAATSPETVTITTVYLHQIVPKPAFVTQDSQAQGLYWEADILDGAALLAGVNTIPQGEIKVKVKSASPKSSHDKVPQGWTASHPGGSSTITFTSASPVSQNSQIASVYFEHPEPVLTIPTLKRTMHVSHWANTLAVQDDVFLLNSGPKLKGHFSRLTHQAISFMRRNVGNVLPTTLTSLSLALPPNVEAPFFIDEVGNVSTSHFRPSPKFRTANLNQRPSGSSHLEIIPRYPLLGGWNYTFSIGYQQPLSDILRYDQQQSQYILSAPFILPIKGTALEDVEVRVVLPEGASDYSVAAPFPIDDTSNTITYSYLDTSGRPTIVLKKSACYERHAQDIIVTYRYTTRNLLQKPAAIASALLGCFFVVAVLKRVEWSIKG